MILQHFEVICDRCGVSEHVKVPVKPDSRLLRKPKKGFVRVSVSPNDTSAEDKIVALAGFHVVKPEQDTMCGDCFLKYQELLLLTEIKM